jgi:hypothetical protein
LQNNNIKAFPYGWVGFFERRGGRKVIGHGRGKDVVKDLIALSMNFEQLRPNIVLTIFNIKGYFDEIGDIYDSKSGMNGGSVGFDNRRFNCGCFWCFCWRKGRRLRHDCILVKCLKENKKKGVRWVAARLGFRAS